MLKKLKTWVNKNLGAIPTCYWRHFWDRTAMKRALKKNSSRTQLQQHKKIAILFIGTNQYINFFPRLYQTCQKYFLPNTEKEFFVFTNVKNYASDAWAGSGLF